MFQEEEDIADSREDKPRVCSNLGPKGQSDEPGPKMPREECC